MTRRDRRIAGWLLIPIAEGLRRGWRALRAHPVQAASGALILAGAGALLLVDRSVGDETVTATTPPVDAPLALPQDPPVTAVRTSTSSSTPATAAVPASSAPAVTSTSAAAPPPAVADTPAAPPPPAPPAVTAAPSSEQAPQCAPPAPLDQLVLADAVGCPFALSIVTVTAVSDDGLEVVTDAQHRWSVGVSGGIGLPLTLTPGVRIALAGTVTSDRAVTASELRLAD